VYRAARLRSRRNPEISRFDLNQFEKSGIQRAGLTIAASLYSTLVPIDWTIRLDRLDRTHFDEMTRRSASARSRRGVLKGIAVAGLAGVHVTAVAARKGGNGRVRGENADCESNLCLPKDSTGRRLCDVLGPAGGTGPTGPTGGTGSTAVTGAG